jgi:uncharacterized cupin superfamily protein
VKMMPLNEARAGQLRAQMVELPPGGPATAIHHCSESNGLIYVLEGKLRLDAGGIEEVLDAGDCACVQSQMPLAWSAADRRRCRVLAVLPGSEPRAAG